MDYKQVKPFNQSTGGNTPGYCLRNVDSGYQIPAKYPNAITAWNNTQQHKDRSIPTGVDVPLFYSFQTDGHINVRLANGQVWSDGNLYSSLDDYLSRHTPVYLGWGESVNGVRVIEQINGGNDMYPNKDDLTNFHNATGWPGHVPNDNDVAYWTTGTSNPSWGKGADQVWKDLIYGVTNYVLGHPQNGTVSKQSVVDYINGHLS